MTVAELLQAPFDGVFEKTIQVTGNQTDALGRATPVSLTRYTGDATVEHMISLGVDEQALRSNGLLWVIVRTVIDVQRLPREGETLRLFAWAGKEKLWMYPRRTVMFSSGGEPLASACSQWLLIDTETRRLAPPSELIQKVPIVALEDEPKAPALQMKFPGELDIHAKRTVQPGEIDGNGHMNNACYLDWAMELLDAEYMKNHALKRLWADYNKELMEGEQADLQYKRMEDTLYLKVYAEEATSFSAKMDFEPA